MQRRGGKAAVRRRVKRCPSFHLMSFPKRGQPNKRRCVGSTKRKGNKRKQKWYRLDWRLRLRVCRVGIIEALHHILHTENPSQRVGTLNAGPDQSHLPVTGTRLTDQTPDLTADRIRDTSFGSRVPLRS